MSADAQPAGYPTTIVMRAMSAERQVSAIENGSANLTLDRIPSNRMTEVSVHYLAQLHPQALPETDFINLDVLASPFTDVRARQALAYASIESGSCSCGRPQCTTHMPDDPAELSRVSSVP